MTRDVAIVGAGAAGAGAAYTLRDADVEVTVFEKSAGVCGRAATRRRNGCIYDHGANYFKPDDESVVDLVTGELDDEGLVDVEQPVYTFDADGTVSPGRDADAHKWTYTEGITQLAKRLFDRAGTTVTRRTRIEKLVRIERGWRLQDESGTNRGAFDALLLTPPAPQTADLLGSSSWELSLCRELRESIAVVPYRTVVSALLHYPFELDREYYGLVNTDKDHDVGWVSREECKPGHVPDGESLLVVQMGGDWSVEHYDRPDEELTGMAADRVATLLDDDRLADPDWTDVQRWRYALPEGSVDHDTLDRAADYGLFFAGDWVAGEGRIHAALRTGLDAGDRIADHLADG